MSLTSIVSLGGGEGRGGEERKGKREGRREDERRGEERKGKERGKGEEKTRGEERRGEGRGGEGRRGEKRRREGEIRGGLLTGMGCSHLLALEADIVGVFPHGVVQRFLEELGRGGSEGVALHLILVLQPQKALPLRVLIEGGDRIQHLLEGGVGNGRVLGGREGREARSCWSRVVHAAVRLTTQMEQNMKRNVILGPDQRLVRALRQQW